MLWKVSEYHVQRPCSEVHNKIQDVIDKHDDLLSIVKKRNLRWYVHILKSLWQDQDNSAKEKAQEGKEDRDRGRKTTSMTGHDWNFKFANLSEQLKIELDETSSVMPQHPSK